MDFDQQLKVKRKYTLNMKNLADCIVYELTHAGDPPVGEDWVKIKQLIENLNDIAVAFDAPHPDKAPKESYFEYLRSKFSKRKK